MGERVYIRKIQRGDPKGVRFLNSWIETGRSGSRILPTRSGIFFFSSSSRREEWLWPAAASEMGFWVYSSSMGRGRRCHYKLGKYVET